MKNQPKVSILIPTYNREEYIDDCILSARAQEYENYEIVIVDNASTDRTWQICQKHASLDKRIRAYQNTENIGPVKNWKRCAQLAEGELSKVLFSDDMLYSDCLSAMTKEFDDSDVGLVFCPVRIGRTPKDTSIAYSNRKKTKHSSEAVAKMLLYGRMPVSPGAAMLRTKDFLTNLHCDFPTTEKRAFKDHGAGPDFMVMALTSDNYKYTVSLTIPHVFFRAHSNSFSIQNKDNSVSLSYVSALSYYFKTRRTKKDWYKCIAVLWLREQVSIRRYVSVRAFAKRNEGDGRPIELILILTYATAYISYTSVRRVCRGIGNIFKICVA